MKVTKERSWFARIQTATPAARHPAAFVNLAMAGILCTSVRAVPPMEFETPSAYPVGNSPWQIVAADFNGDHKIDVATAISGGWSETNLVEVLFGAGDGTFPPPTPTHRSPDPCPL